jgi:oligopeptide transport system substrate-binding protein
MAKLIYKTLSVFIIFLLIVTFNKSIFVYADDSIVANQITGDLNGDSKVNSLDYALMKKYLSPQSGHFPITGDVDGDSKLTSSDYTTLKRYLLNQIKHFPIEGRIISKVNDINTTVKQGDQYSLPDNVNAIMVDESIRNVPITWDPNVVNTNIIGTYTFEGTVTGYIQKIKLTLIVTSSVEQSLIYNLGSEPKTIDPTLNSSVDGSNVINSTFEGLTRITDKMVPGPGVAKTWDISPDGKTYTFHLREDAKWSDGRAVTANDFYFSWSRLLNPATNADYAYQMFYIKNAENYFNKKEILSNVGIKAIDDLTLKVTLNAPTPYFLELCSWSTFAPLRSDIINSNSQGWARNPETYIGNGPFKLTSWIHNDSMQFVKNINYWNAKNITLNKMKWSMINNDFTYMTEWYNGDIDIIGSVPTDQIPQLIANNEIKISPYNGIYGLYLNTTKAPFDNIKFRQALALSINRSFITNGILKAGQQPAGAWVPTGLKEPDGKDFRDTTPSYYNTDGDIAKAKQLLIESGVDTSNLTIQYLYNTSSAHKAIGEAIQQMWKQNLGINVTLIDQDWATFLAIETAGDYQVARAGWIGDYSDPMTFLDLFVSNSGLDAPRYSNPNFDALIALAKNEPDPVKRMTFMHEAEDILMNEMPIIPIYYYVEDLCINPKVMGTYMTTNGTIYFDDVQILALP